MDSFTRLLRTLFVMTAIALTAAACPESNSCVGEGNCNNYGNPLTPGTSNEVTGVQLTAWNKDITIGSGPCEADVTVEAKINPPSAPQKVDEWKVSAGEFVRTGDTTGVFKLRGAGTYTVTAIAQGKSVTETITLKCGAQPPPAGQEPSVDLKFNGQDGPFNSNSPLSGEITASLKQCTTGYWTDGPFKGQIFGNGSKWTVTVNASTRYEAECEHQGQKDSDELRFIIGSAPLPTQPSLTVTPSSLTFQRGGTSCPATGPQTITVSANNPITITSANTALATVSVSTLPAGNNQQVVVTPQGSAAGVTYITITAGGRTETVALQFNACQAQAVCSVTSIDYTPRGGTLGVNQNVQLTAVTSSSWPSNCMLVWLTDRNSTLKILGADSVTQICNSNGSNCVWYYSGLRGTISGVAPGSAQGIARVISNNGSSWSMTGVEKGYTWTVVQTLQALGLRWPDPPPPLVTDKTYPDRKICQTWQCQGDR